MNADALLARIPHLDVLQAARYAVVEPAWVVGGSVRDLLLGRDPVDIDVASPAPQALAEQFARRISGRVVPMDIERGTWRVAIGGKYLDFSRFRDKDIRGDLKGRDFTFNAIAVSLATPGEPAELLDPFHGIEDLRAGILRLVQPEAFANDPARILRAYRFQAELDVVIEEQTEQAIKRDAHLLAQVAPERLLAEWWKLCAAPHAGTAIRAMDESGALVSLFPEFQVMKGIVQNVYHHLDVWGHTMLAMQNMTEMLADPHAYFRDLTPEFQPIIDDPHRRARLVFLSLLHDIGKPATRTVNAGKVHFYRHDIVGASIASCICGRLRASKDDCNAICRIIRLHLRPLFMMRNMLEGRLSRKSMTKFFDETEESAREIMLLAMADKLAGLGTAAEPNIDERLRELYRILLAFYHEHYRPALDTPLVTGDDLIHELHLTPGPHIGLLLHHLRDRQIDGALTTRKEALRWAERHQ